MTCAGLLRHSWISPNNQLNLQGEALASCIKLSHSFTLVWVGRHDLWFFEYVIMFSPSGDTAASSSDGDKSSSDTGTESGT